MQRMRPLLATGAALLCLSCQNGPFEAQLPQLATPDCLQGSAAVESATAGERIYATTCSYCHGVEGLGTTGRAPALNANKSLLAAPERGIQMILVTQTPAARQHGMEVGDLVAMVGDLDSDDVADVMTYVLNAWGNCAGPVTTAQVDAVRSAGN